MKPPRHMHIVAPVRAPSDVAPLVAAGAAEFYGGVYDHELADGLGPGVSSNTRPPGLGQIAGFEALAETADRIRDAGGRLHLVLNKDSVPGPQLPGMMALARRAHTGAGIDRFIAADPALVAQLVDEGLSVHASSLAGVMNAQAVAFFASLGARRVILPDVLGQDEIARIVAAAGDTEIELFSMPTGCLHIQGLCGIDHDLEQRDDPLARDRVPSFGAAGWLARNVAARLCDGRLRRLKVLCAHGSRPCQPERFDILPAEGYPWDPAMPARLADTFAQRSLRGPACWVCCLWAWARLGVTSVKILGRELPLGARVRMTRLFAAARDLAETTEDESAFSTAARAHYRRAFLMPCPGNTAGACGWRDGEGPTHA